MRFLRNKFKKKFKVPTVSMDSSTDQMNLNLKRITYVISIVYLKMSYKTRLKSYVLKLLRKVSKISPYFIINCCCYQTKSFNTQPI